MPASNAGETRTARSDDGWGLAVADIAPDLARRFNLERRSGVVVTDVGPDSAAGDAGLHPGDVVTQVDRQPIASVAQYRKALAGAAKHGRLPLLVERGGQSLFVVLKRPS